MIGKAWCIWLQNSSCVGVPGCSVHHNLLLHNMEGHCKAAAYATSWLLCKLCIDAIGLYYSVGFQGFCLQGCHCKHPASKACVKCVQLKTMLSSSRNARETFKGPGFGLSQTCGTHPATQQPQPMNLLQALRWRQVVSAHTYIEGIG